MRYYITISLLFIYSIIISQDYINTIIESENHPLIENIYKYNDDQYIIPYDFGPWDSTFTSFIITDFENSYDIHHRDIDSGINPLEKIGNNYYHVGERAKSSEEVLICKKYSSDLKEVVWKREYATKGVSTINAGFTSLNNNLYLLNVNRFSNSPLYWTLQIVKIDTSGEEFWTKYYGEHAKYNYAWDFKPSLDNNLFLSQTISHHEINSTSTRLLKLNPEGEIIWDTEVKEELKGGTTLIHITELSDSNIIQMYEVDKFLDPIFIQNNWNWNPTKLKWHDKNGDSIKSKLLTVTKKDRLYLAQMEAGIGDYFYMYGNLEIDTDNIYDYTYGIIMKFDNNGDTVWVHRYKHPSYVDEKASHTIIDLIELNNGDIIVLGDIRGRDNNDETYAKIWVMRLNEKGCFGTATCDEYITAVDKVKPDTLTKKDIILFPNPTTGIFHFKETWLEELKSISIFNCYGKEIYKNKKIINNEIDMSSKPSGIYFVKIKLKGNINHTSKLIKI